MSHTPLPTLYIPHGGGPCFFMEWDPPETWNTMAAFLRGLAGTLPRRPRAVVVVSAHWEEKVPSVTTGQHPALMYDYYGFPEHTYALTYPAPGAPLLAEQVGTLLERAGIAHAEDSSRGFDHGVFVPFKLIYPEADIPVVQLSLKAGLDAAEHLAIGRALALLRSEDVLLVGSGMSYHNLRRLMRGEKDPSAEEFDAWLTGTLTKQVGRARSGALEKWYAASGALDAHPRAEHLLSLMVMVGAAEEEAGTRIFTDQVMGARVSAYQFGS